jgi:Holliday junction resolvase RusA-like endonuclease
MIEILIPGDPVGKARPRVTRWGTFTPQKTVNYETLIRELFIIKYPNFQPLDSALSMTLNVFHSIPKSASRKKFSKMIEGKIRPAKRPDIDNVLKIVGDALKGLAYGDDGQIVKVNAEKFYSETPRLQIQISAIEDAP